MDKRTRARELAMQGLYQLDVQGSDLLGRLEQFFAENEPDSKVRKLAFQWCSNAWENVARCDQLITDSTIKWGMSRLCPVDKSILRLAVFHLSICPDIPERVTINEAIELDKN